MSILIKGMEMPKNCSKCPLHFYEGQAVCSCRALPAIDDDEILKPWKNKRKDCPLVPVPDHGRLIDADAAKESLKPKDSISCYKTEWTWGELYERDSVKIDKLPTIIQAEEGE